MVVEDNHDVGTRQGIDHGIHDIHGVLAAKLRICGHSVIGDGWIAFQRFVGPGEPDRIHADLANLTDDLRERRVIKTTGNEFFLIEAVPVYGRETHSVTGRVENPIAAGVKWRCGLMILSAGEGGLANEEGCREEQDGSGNWNLHGTSIRGEGIDSLQLRARSMAQSID
jgi:hypothetical protein